jgi:hypothetical protein
MRLPKYWRYFLGSAGMALAAGVGFGTAYHWTVAFFAFMAVLSLFLVYLERIIERRQRDPRRLHLDEQGMTYRDLQGVEHHAEWNKITKVTWWPPTYGPLEGLPNWTIHVGQSYFEVDDWWGSEVAALPKWLVEKLPGFAQCAAPDGKGGYVGRDGLIWSRASDA